MNFDFSYFVSVFPEIVTYLPTTLFIAIISIVIAIIVGLFIALIRVQKVLVVDSLLALYISLFRGMPTVVLLFIIYYGLPQLFPSLKGISAMAAALLCFSLKYSAYLAEIFRAGLESVDNGQREAGMAMGLSLTNIYRHIVLPQAFVNALPSTGNMFISLLKDSSVAFFVGVPELLSAGKLITAESYKFFETYAKIDGWKPSGTELFLASEKSNLDLETLARVNPDIIITSDLAHGKANTYAESLEQYCNKKPKILMINEVSDQYFDLLSQNEGQTILLLASQ